MPARVPVARALISLAALVFLAAGIALRLRPRSHYRIASVSRGSVWGHLELRGRLEPISTVKIGSPLAGRVASVAVSVGDMVKRGQTLARLEDAELRALAAGAAAQSVAAEADVRQAQVRLIDLERGGEGVDPSPDGADNPEPDVDDAALAMAEVQLVRALAVLQKQRALAAAALVVFRRATLQSPIDGMVLERSVEAGEVVSASARGAPLFVIATSPSHLRLVAAVAEVDVPQMRPESVEFTTPAFPTRRFTGTMTAAWPTAAPRQTPTEYQVIAEVANDDLALWPGLSALLEVPAHSAPQALRVPVEALAFSPGGAPGLPEGKRSLWALRNGVPERIQVSVGVTGDGFAEIRDPPLAPGTAIITGVTGSMTQKRP